jgi:hypothetical protein
VADGLGQHRLEPSALVPRTRRIWLAELDDGQHPAYGPDDQDHRHGRDREGQNGADDLDAAHAQLLGFDAAVSLTG